MKKLVRTSLNNVANKRGVRDLNIQLYSHDKNNAGFEFVIKNEVDLSEYKAKVLFDFQESFATWETKGTIEGNVVKVKFDTTFITKCEEVIGYLFLDSETDTLDVFKFKFNVVLSEIDKYDLAKRGFRYIKDQEVVDVITRSELQEELAKIQVTGGVDLSGYLTTTAAEEMYAKKTDLPTPYNDSALVERVTSLENKTDRDTVYDDTSVKERLTTLENKPPVDLSNYATKDELANLSGSQPTVDTSNLVTRQDLEDKHYATEQSLNNYALKSEIPTPYNDSELVQKIGQLEARVDKDTVYDDAPLKERVTALESKAIEGGAYDDTDLRNRVVALENKPTVDATHFITEEILESKGFLTTHQDISNLATKEELAKAVTKEELEEKHYITNEQISSTYATKSEIPQPYNDTELVKRITVLENKQDNDTVYDDAELKRRVTTLEEKPSVDMSNFVTTATLESKGYLTTHQDISNLVTKQELEPYAKKSELPAPYNDSALVNRVSALESKQDKDTVYNDTEVKQRLIALENRPTTGGGLGTEDVATYTNNIIYVPNGNIVYDKNLKKLYIPKCNVHVGKTSHWCEAQEVSLNGSAGFIVFYKAQKRINAGSVNSTNDVLLGYYDNNIGNYYLNTFSKALKKKKIACLGDSITEGAKANGWQWHRYIDKYFKENGVETTIVNLGVGGTSVCTSSYVSASLQPFVNRLNTIPTDADVIVIFGGTNDWGNNATLGTISDSESSSFYGAYKYMLEWLANNRPNAKILTITPLKRYYRGYTSTWTNAQTTRNSKGQLLQDYVRAVKEVSEMYAIPCVDLHNESGLNPVLEIVRTKYMEDGLHPTAEGNKKMYPIILNKLKPLVEYD
nr:MAG TPA: GDSL like Lipase Acylhydrolase [Caudoviricetes sp.]